MEASTPVVAVAGLAALAAAGYEVSKSRRILPQIELELQSCENGQPSF